MTDVTESPVYVGWCYCSLTSLLNVKGLELGSEITNGVHLWWWRQFGIFKCSKAYSSDPNVKYVNK